MESESQGTRVSVIVPNFNGAGFLGRCLDSLAAQSHPAHEVIVVDNGSSDGSPEIAERWAPLVRVLRRKANSGFAAAANAGARSAGGEWLGLLHNDTEADPNWLSACLETAARHPESAFVASRIMDFGDRSLVFSSGDCFLKAGIGYRRGQGQALRPDHLEEIEVFAPSGCATLFRRNVFQESGGYEECFFAYLEDVDLAVRLQAAGRHGWYSPSAIVYHIGAATSGGEFSRLSVRLRTRNSLLLLLRNYTAGMAFRFLPQIFISQTFWLARVISRRRLLSYIRGLGSALRLAPSALAARKRLEVSSPVAETRLQEAILESEALARRDVAAGTNELSSSFLRLYFGLHRPTSGAGSRTGSL